MLMENAISLNRGIDNQEECRKRQELHERLGDIMNIIELYNDDGVVLRKEGKAALFLEVDGCEFELTSTSYEPCTYILLEGQTFAMIHNGFEVYNAADLLVKGHKILSITGHEYDLAKFCRLLAGVVRMGSSEFGHEFEFGYVEAKVMSVYQG